MSAYQTAAIIQIIAGLALSVWALRALLQSPPPPRWVLVVASLTSMAAGLARFLEDSSVISLVLTVPLIVFGLAAPHLRSSDPSDTLDGCDTPPEPLDAGPDGSH